MFTFVANVPRRLPHSVMGSNGVQHVREDETNDVWGVEGKSKFCQLALLNAEIITALDDRQERHAPVGKLRIH